MVEEQLLPGGNATLGEVVRVGATVRKPWLPQTGRVHDYLRLLRDRGVDVPDVHGRDEQGRQVVEFVAGELAMDHGPLPPDALRRVGGIVRRIHDRSPAAVPGEGWEVLLPADGADLVCHNDLAPWNLITGDRWVFIDWDGAGPSTRSWDLAYAAQAFAMLVEGEPVDRAAARLRAFVDGYTDPVADDLAADDPGADDPATDDLIGAAVRRLPDLLGPRTTAMYELLAASARSGRQPWARMFHDGHGDHWREAARYVTRHRDAWAAALADD